MGGEGFIGTEDWCFNCGDAGHLGDVSHETSLCRANADLGNLRTAPRPPTSMTSQGNPQRLASTTPAVDPSLTRALRCPRNQARNHNASGKTRTVGEMDMGPHFLSTSEDRGERRNDRGWKPWMRELGRRTMTMTSFPETSRIGRCRRTNGATTKLNRTGS